MRQEELEKTKTNLQLKEVAVEGLRLIAQEQTAKIKDLEKELEDAQHALFQVLENEDWKTWFVKSSLYLLVNITFTCWLVIFYTLFECSWNIPHVLMATT